MIVMEYKYRHLNRWELASIAKELGMELTDGMDIDQALSDCYWIGRLHEKRMQELHRGKDDK